MHTLSQHTLMRTYTINDGLVSNQIRGFYQDSKGFLWIITWEGLSRHDGHTFRNYTTANGLAHSLVNAMIEGKDGSLYVAENNGSVDVIHRGEVLPARRKKNTSVINAFFRDSTGSILAPSDEVGIRVFDEGSILDLPLPKQRISTTGVIPEGDHFFVCGIPAGVLRADQSFLKQWPASSDEYRCLLKDDRDRIWVGTTNGVKWINRSPGPQQFDLINTPFEKAPWNQWAIQDMLQSKDGSIWLAANGGLIQIRTDLTWRMYDRSDGLPTENVTNLFEDKSGFLWIGTDQGIARLDVNNTIDSYTMDRELAYTLSNDILVTADSSVLILFNTNAIHRFRENRLSNIIPIGKRGDAIDLLVIQQDTLVITNQGWYAISGNQLEVWDKLPFSPAGILLNINESSILSVTNQDVQLTTAAGIIMDTSVNHLIYALAMDKEGAVWMGTTVDGVHRARIVTTANGNKGIEVENFTALLPDPTIRSLHVDDHDNIWIGTRYNGLIQLHYDSLQRKFVTSVFDHNDGFISNFIRAIASDAAGNIWVGSNAGLEKLIPTVTGYHAFPFSRVHNFFATITKIAVGPGQTVWCTTTTGVTCIRDAGYDTMSAPVTFITAVITADTVLADPGDHLPFDLRYTHNSIDIEFACNDPVNGDQIKYTYRLAGGQDTTWSHPQPFHKVSFANLLPGDYNFEVRALGWNGTLGEKASYSFSILPPFWKQTWFVVLFASALLLLFYLFYRQRFIQLRRVQDVRNRIASDLHDEIGSSLTHVNILSEIGKKQIEAGAETLPIFKRISEEAQSSSEALDDIIWSVSSRSETAEDLVSRMRRYAAELLDSKGISFVLQDQLPDENKALNLELRRDFYLIYKELLRNVVKHADATNVQLIVREDNHLLWLEIHDDGHGFDPDLPTQRHGLASIRSRVSKRKGQFSIHSSNTDGTWIRIGLPAR